MTKIMKSQQLFLSFLVQDPWRGGGSTTSSYRPMPWLTGRCELSWGGKCLWHSQAPQEQYPGRAIRSLQPGKPLLWAQFCSLLKEFHWEWNQHEGTGISLTRTSCHIHASFSYKIHSFSDASPHLPPRSTFKFHCF